MGGGVEWSSWGHRFDAGGASEVTKRSQRNVLKIRFEVEGTTTKVRMRAKGTTRRPARRRWSVASRRVGGSVHTARPKPRRKKHAKRTARRASGQT